MILGIIAGESQFPILVTLGAKKQSIPVVAVGFVGHTDPSVEELVDDFLWVKVGQLGKTISFFKKKHVKDVVFAGGIKKVKVLNIRPDIKGIKLLLRCRGKGDSTILGEVVKFFESEGMKVISPLKFLPELHVPEGILTKRKPSHKEMKDIKFGWGIAKNIGRLDIGQCIVIKNEMVVAVEALEGTDSTIRRAGQLVGKGCTVIKIFKPGQSEYVDQPSVGLNTIKTMLEAKATCLAIEANKSLFFDKEEAIKLANKEKIAIIGIK